MDQMISIPDRRTKRGACELGLILLGAAAVIVTIITAEFKRGSIDSGFVWIYFYELGTWYALVLLFWLGAFAFHAWRRRLKVRIMLALLYSLLCTVSVMLLRAYLGAFDVWEWAPNYYYHPTFFKSLCAESGQIMNRRYFLTPLGMAVVLVLQSRKAKAVGKVLRRKVIWPMGSFLNGANELGHLIYFYNEDVVTFDDLLGYMYQYNDEKTMTDLFFVIRLCDQEDLYELLFLSCGDLMTRKQYLYFRNRYIQRVGGELPLSAFFLDGQFNVSTTEGG